jgi:hypothetical protein
VPLCSCVCRSGGGGEEGGVEASCAGGGLSRARVGLVSSRRTPMVSIVRAQRSPLLAHCWRWCRALIKEGMCVRTAPTRPRPRRPPPSPSGSSTGTHRLRPRRSDRSNASARRESYFLFLAVGAPLCDSLCWQPFPLFSPAIPRRTVSHAPVLCLMPLRRSVCEFVSVRPATCVECRRSIAAS